MRRSQGLSGASRARRKEFARQVKMRIREAATTETAHLLRNRKYRLVTLGSVETEVDEGVVAPSEGADVEERSEKSASRVLLVIDDDIEWTDLLQIFFSTKYDVRVAHSGLEAIELIEETQPSVIILDLVMPTLDGFGLLERLGTTAASGTPSLLTTGWTNSDIEARAAALGCAAVLKKPISLAELDRVVAALIELPPPVQPANDPEEKT